MKLMKFAAHSLLLALVLTLGASCKKKQEAPKTEPSASPTTGSGSAAAPPTTPTTPPAGETAGKEAPYATVDEAGTAMVAVFDKMVAAVTTGGDDCAKIGANLKALIPEVKVVMARGKGIDSDEAKKKEFDQKYGEAMMKKMEAPMAAVEKCKDNPDVKEFGASLGG